MEKDPALHTIQAAIQALGRGFDVNYDTRLLYCKGAAGFRLVEVSDEHLRDVALADGLVVPAVPRDVSCFPEPARREGTGACSFYEMAEYFNRKAQLTGNVPLGIFNAAFSFTGSQKADAASAKNLGLEGKYVPLCKVLLTRQPLQLVEEVKRAMLLSWEPSSLARFIESYGTHIITSVTVGGKDVIYIKQHVSSSISAEEIKNYLRDIADQRFSDTEGHNISGPLQLKDRNMEAPAFIGQGVHSQPSNTPYLAAKEDVTVIFRRRGGDDLVQSHHQWAKTVSSAPDVIHMTFHPLTALLEGVPGADHVIRAINLYLEYKPPIEELRYFLEFQIPRLWAPVRNDLLGSDRREPICPALQFSMMGKKLYVSQEQVTVGRRPVTGLRLFLEGAKQNRLCIQVLHLASLPKILKPYWDAHIGIGAPKWQGPEEQDSRWFEPVKWKSFSHVSTAPVEYHDTLIGDISGVYVVTGAQLGVWDFGSKSVLYMKLLYSKVPGCTIRRSLWDHNPSGTHKGLAPADPAELGDASSSDSGKFYKIVDMSEMCKGPEDSPGHWLVTGGKLGIDKGRIVLRVKYSLLNY